MITQYSYGQNTCASKRNNVIERYKRSAAEEVRADLQSKRGKAVLVLENLDYNINIGSGIRAANAFLAKETYVVGRRKVDSRSAVGATHYERAFHADTFDEVFQKLKADGYEIWAMENVTDGVHTPENLALIPIPEKVAFVLGNESDGLRLETCQNCDRLIYVKQFGAIRSLNVAQTCAVCLYAYSVQHYLQD